MPAHTAGRRKRKERAITLPNAQRSVRVALRKALPTLVPQTRGRQITRMAVYTREELPTLFRELEAKPEQIFLLFGERYLCQQTASRLEKILLASTGTVHPIDGEQESMENTLNRLKNFSLLPGRQLFKVTDTRVFHSKNLSQSIWARAARAHAANKTDQAGRALLSLLNAGGLAAGDEEADLARLSEEEWNHYFGFSKPKENLAWASEILARITADGAVDSTHDTGSPEQQLLQVLQSGIPKGNILVLISEEVDKRKKLYQYLKKQHTIIDLAVETGASSRAQKSQKAVLTELLETTLAANGKKMEPRAIKVLYDRVGFHPVALVNELQKLIDYTGTQSRITLQDVDAMIGRTRQEAIFELTTALTGGQARKALTMAERLQENGLHPLAIIASLRKLVRALLLCRALSMLPTIDFSPGMSAQVFQKTCLPALKEIETWKKELGGHPYALYMQFKTASTYPLATLEAWLKKILEAEMRLKGSALTPEIILQHLLIELMRMSNPDFS